MSEFKRLCDEHGISKKCNCDTCFNQPRHYPTLSELLNMVEEKWSEMYGTRPVPPRPRKVNR